ncbi:gem-associated protein 4-like [Asterias rubens]|uniref:gem-associated protein 4-like n=1 Tax=Asterias rubens TaxID=7604 RepID=UPI00145599B4|nr:gem-associated protein 4-like [Asterias rubens]
MMHFEAEIALLQSSFYCFTDCTNKALPLEQRVNVNAVCHAITEVVQGLDRDRSDGEQLHWHFKLHAILLCKLLKKKNKKKCRKNRMAEEEERRKPHPHPSLTSDNVVDCAMKGFDGVMRAIPDCVDLDLYLAVAKNLEWGHLCSQVLLSLHREVAKVLLQDISSTCISEGHQEFLMSILISVLRQVHLDTKKPEIRTTTNKPSCTAADGTGALQLVMSTCQQILTMKSEITKKTMRSEVIEALKECLTNLVQELFPTERHPEVNITDPTKHSTKAHPLLSLLSTGSNCLSEVYSLHQICSTNLGDHLGSSPYKEEVKTASLADSSKEEDSTKSVNSNSLLMAVSTLVSTLRDILLEDWTDFFTIPSSDVLLCEEMASSVSNIPHPPLDVPNEIARLGRSTLQSLQRLGHHLDQLPLETTHSIQKHCDDLIGYISGQLDQWGDVEDEMTSAGSATDTYSRNTWLEEAIGKVDGRLNEYEDYLGQLMSSHDLWEEESWIECLERNTAILANPRFVKQLIDIVMVMDQQYFSEGIIQRVLKVFLGSYAPLPFLLQNTLRDHLWTQSAGVTIFTRHPVQNVDHELTSLFNRLVALAQGLENTEVFQALSCVAIQSPTKTLHQAVQRAVSNASVCQAVCQVLQAMPSLATFKLHGDQWPLLCHLILETGGNLSTSTNEEANLLQLVTTLLQPYRPFLDPLGPFWMPPVLSTRAVCQVCVLPNLETSPQNGGRMDILTALKLLKELLNIRDNSDAMINVLGSSPFPIMLCLCDLLDGCHLLWDGVVTATQSTDMKEVVLCLLGRIARIIKEKHNQGNNCAEHGVAWLLNRVSVTLHWTTSLYVNELMSELLPQQKKTIPECLFDICNFPDSSWYPVASDDTSRALPLVETLTDLLQCSRVSDKMVDILVQGLQVKEIPHQSFQEAITLALVQVLPHCIMGEWQCIMGMLKQLLANEILCVPCSTQYLTELPMVNISGFKVHLSLSQLLLSVMQLLTSPCCQDWATPQLLHHVTRCHVNTMQSLTPEILTSDLHNESASLFVIGQFFCHTCEVISVLPTHELKEQVFVLTLQFMSHLEEMMNHSKDVNQEWTNQKALLELVANQKLAGEQKKTLLQKITNIS